MAKTKWIVPAVALVLCAASLIGAGYAAYSATLKDSETVTADNNFITLTLGQTAFANKEIDIWYAEETNYQNGDNPTYEYKPYASRDGSSNVIALGAISVAADKEYAASANDTTTYNLTIGSVTYENNGQSLTGASVKLYTNANCTEQVNSLDGLTYGATYYLGFYYVHDDEDNLNVRPNATFNIYYTLTANAVMAQTPN